VIEKNVVVEPLISIIIPTFNRASMLKESIKSVENQRYSNYEIIIVDDCSSDSTEKVVKQYIIKNSKISYFRNKNNYGAGYSRKIGYEKSKGEFLIFADDDDYYTDYDFFYKAIKEFDTDIAFVSGNSLIKYENTGKYNFIPLNVKGKINRRLYLQNFQNGYDKPNSTFTTIFNKEMLEKSNIKNLIMMNDSAIYLRALLSGDAIILEDIIGVYRIHNNNITFNLKLDFLIQNLEEKKYIYDEMKNDKIIENIEKWWMDQLIVTCKYYILGSKPNDLEYNKLLLWCKNNTENQKKAEIEKKLNDVYITIKT